MIKTGTIERIITAALYTAYIEGEKPLSILMVAKVESGKTKLAARFHPNIGIRYITDATAFGIWRDLHGDIETGALKHIIFPDLLTPLSKGYDTRKSFVMFLSGLIEEGIAEIHTGFLKPIVLQAPSAVGVVACVAKEAFEDARRGWAKMGFISRMLPISYDYSESTIDEILGSIAIRSYIHDKSKTLKFPATKVPVSLPKAIAQATIEIDKELMKAMEPSYHSYGFRLLVQLQRLLMGMALSNDRLQVTWNDFHTLDKEFKEYLGLRYPKI